MMKKRIFLACILFLTAPAHALYDPAPEPSIAAAEGEWIGTLRYRDYQKPDHFETLPTRTVIALSAPDTLAVHAVYDDGPNKVVHSYETMRFDLNAKRLEWRYGLKESGFDGYRIVADGNDGDCRRFTVESDLQGEKENAAQKGGRRYEITLCATRIEWVKYEVDAQGASLERSRTTLSRGSNTPVSL
jgi:hypothetical protein